MQLLGRWIFEFLNIFVGVLEHFDGFFAAGEVNVDGRTGDGIDGVRGQDLLVGFDVVVFAADGDGVGDEEVDLEEEDDGSEPGRKKFSEDMM